MPPRENRDRDTDVPDKRNNEIATDDIPKRKNESANEDVSKKRKIPDKRKNESAKKPSKYPGTKRDKKMAGLLAKLEKDYDVEGKKLEELQQNIGTHKSTFYSMIEEKMKDFPKRDQIWMEGKVWGLYMELQASSHQQLPVDSTS